MGKNLGSRYLPMGRVQKSPGMVGWGLWDLGTQSVIRWSVVHGSNFLKSLSL